MKCKISVRASTQVIHVPTDYPTIQEAINNASSGDTVFVHIGVYDEHVVVNKSISLIGENRDSTIIDGNGTGKVITIKASNVSIQGFTIRNSGTLPYDSGIFIDHSSGNNVSNNTISNTNDGVSLYYSSNNLISSNIISSNYYGVVLSSSSYNVVSDNFISSNLHYGIHLYSSSDNVVSDNILYSNIYGIYLDSSGDNVVVSNTISFNYQVGMYIASYSSNNTIYHNNFNNTKNVQSGIANVWDYEGEGNYWNDYTGRDLNRDGIGDTPYAIAADNQDNYPLIGMFSDFNIVFEREIYSVTIISNSTISDFRFEVGAETGNNIIRFNVTGEDGTVGFCRVKVPTKLMKYPYIVLVGSEEVVPTLLDFPNRTYVRLYFAYLYENYTITIISSETLRLYYELLDKYFKLQEQLYSLNETYYSLLNNYDKLQIDLYNLNQTYYSLLNNYVILSGNYSQLQKSFDELKASYQMIHNLNETYYSLLNNYNILLDNYSQLRISFDDLNNSYQQHLLNYSEQIQNIQNLVYIFAATTAIFIITTIYLSKRAHASITTKARAIEER